MNHKTAMRCFSVLFAWVAISAADATGDGIDPGMIGRWDGSAKIIVNWCRQQRLPVSIDIDADGSVTGKVGDAELSHGRFARNRGWLGRKLNLATDYIVTGDLQGPVVAAEGITRAAVSMPLQFGDRTFTGGVHTSGSKIGGRERMVLSAMSLRLVKKSRAQIHSEP